MPSCRLQQGDQGLCEFQKALESSRPHGAGIPMRGAGLSLQDEAKRHIGETYEAASSETAEDESQQLLLTGPNKCLAIQLSLLYTVTSHLEDSFGYDAVRRRT